MAAAPVKDMIFGSDLQSLLTDFQNVIKSFAELDALKVHHEKLLAAARVNVEQRVNDATIQCQNLPDGNDVLERRKFVLGIWLKKQNAQAKEEEDTAELHHSCIRIVFETKIREVITWAYREWKETPQHVPLL